MKRRVKKDNRKSCFNARSEARLSGQNSSHLLEGFTCKIMYDSCSNWQERSPTINAMSCL